MSADGAVAEDTETLVYLVRYGMEEGFSAFGIVPRLTHLPFVEDVVSMRCYEGSHEDPFGDHGPVDAGRRRDRDLRVCVDGLFPDVICSGADKMDEFCHDD